jgi:hypothetical protein
MKASAVGVGLVPQKLVAPKGVKRDSARALTASLLLLLFFFCGFSPAIRPPRVATPSQVATQTAATDPRTGTIDMDMITTGHSALDRGQLAALKVELY